MPENTEPAVVPEQLTDPWERYVAIPLNGVLERNQFPPLLTAFLALILGFLAYQVVGTIAIVVLLVLNNVGLEQMLQDLPALFEEQASTLISANSIGLILGMGVLAFLLTRLHTDEVVAFLRLRKPDVGMVVLAVLGLFALMPAVQWAGTVNQDIPLPEALRAFEESQMALIEKVLLGDLGVVFGISMLALTPAICEELFFRGYIQRHFERSLGAWSGILVTGVVFGLYHLRLTQVLPLSLLGIFLAYLAWRTGSLWVPIIVHFANNAFAVATAEFVKNRSDLNFTDIEKMNIPWYIVIIGSVVFALLVYVIERWAQVLRTRAS